MKFSFIITGQDQFNIYLNRCNYEKGKKSARTPKKLFQVEDTKAGKLHTANYFTYAWLKQSIQEFFLLLMFLFWFWQKMLVMEVPCM